MAKNQPNKSAVTGGKREEQDVTMTTTSYHHLLAEMENTTLKSDKITWYQRVEIKVSVDRFL